MSIQKWGDLDGKNVMGTVNKIHDGDTIHVIAPVGEADGMYEIVCRLSGIDAPELKVNKTAKATLETIIKETDGKVFCNFGKKDKYGRILTTLRGDPTKPTINQRMLDMGQAKEYYGGKRK